MTNTDRPKSRFFYTVAAMFAAVILLFLAIWRFGIEPYHRQMRFAERLDEGYSNAYLESIGIREKLPDWLPEGIRNFFRLEYIDTLQILGSTTEVLSKQDAREIWQLYWLRSVWFDNTHFPANDPLPLVSAHLESVELTRTNVDDEMARKLPVLPKVDGLILHENPRLTSEGIRLFLEKTPNVYLFGLETTVSLEGRVLETMSRLDELRRLSLDAPSIEKDSLRLLLATKGIESLNLYIPSLTDTELRVLEHIPTLDSLSVSGADTDGGFFEALAGLPNLRYLTASGAPISDDNLRHLKNCPVLHSVVLDQTAVTDAGLEHLGEMEHLTLLHLNGNRITDAGVAHLRGLKNLKRLELSNTDITDAALEIIGQLDLNHLDVSKCPGITKEGLERFKQSIRKGMTVNLNYIKP